MKTLWLALLLLAPLASARAEGGAAALSQDPLTEQIRRKAILPGAGITSVFRLGNGQALTVKVDEQEALSGLKPVSGLASKSEPKAKTKKLPKEAREQLKTIKKDGWNPARGAGHRGAL